MKKLIAFVGSLLVVAPAIAQNSQTPPKNKMEGVSKVQQKDVKNTPAPNNKATQSSIKSPNKGSIKSPANSQLKNADKAKLKNSSNSNFKNATNTGK